YDLFHEFGTPGNWRAPFVVINDTIQTPNGVDDEFIWPYVHIGPSPDPDKRRVYVIGNNAYSPGNPSENVLIAYADFDDVDLENQSTFDWTYNTIPLLDEWNQGIPEWIRPHLSMCVSDDGKVALMGYNTNDEIFVFLNENYGIGDYEYFSECYQFNTWNPQNLNGSYFFADENGEPYTLFWSFAPCNNMNSIFLDNSNKLNFCGSFGLQCYEGFYWFNLVYPKAFQFDIDTQEFSFHDLYIEGANPSDNNPMVPWDLNEDGIVDSLLQNGDPYMVEGFPLLYSYTGAAFHENTFKIVKNEEKGWLAAVWHDGLKSKYAYEGVPGYEEWLEVPEIAICISADNGESWSEVIFLNSIETPEFSEMIPVYIYPGDLIEDLGDDHGKLHLFFLDDYSYGSYVHGNGENLGGMQMYCSLDIDFDYLVLAENETIPQVSYELYNYPNPFNPETKITFSVPNDFEKSPIEIYNVKGQKVKTLECNNHVIAKATESLYHITWDGTDENNKPVSSGVYLYKLSIDGKTKAVRKMILLR
ncbi:MAG: T9SS type A sorting domain-containing protein, partial [Candidatus Cloacimonetes bacterium]|nr:T9SS type A sorting domain-containing protein [Candidatus Cloacimonadota bacterium]